MVAFDYICLPAGRPAETRPCHQPMKRHSGWLRRWSLDYQWSVRDQSRQLLPSLSSICSWIEQGERVRAQGGGTGLEHRVRAGCGESAITRGEEERALGVHNGSTMGPQWVRNGSAMGPQWVHNGSTMGPQLVHNLYRLRTLQSPPELAA